MDLRFNGVECTERKFVFGLEKLGINALDLSVSPEATVKIVNNYTEELKNSMLKMFMILPIYQAQRYLDAYDLLSSALNEMRRTYELEYIPFRPMRDDRQMKLMMATK